MHPVPGRLTGRVRRGRGVFSGVGAIYGLYHNTVQPGQGRAPDRGASGEGDGPLLSLPHLEKKKTSNDPGGCKRGSTGGSWRHAAPALGVFLRSGAGHNNTVRVEGLQTTGERDPSISPVVSRVCIGFWWWGTIVSLRSGSSLRTALRGHHGLALWHCHAWDTP